jgi:hypothetical protein
VNTIYPDGIVEALIDWCAEHAAERPWPVTIVGLSYGYALARFQILHARRVVAAGDGLWIDFPLGRSKERAHHADRSLIEIKEPDWLVEAISVLTTGKRTELILPPASLGAATSSVDRLKRELRRAGIDATGFELSPSVLCRTGIVHAQDRGFMTSCIGVGFDPGFETIIIHDRRRTVMPFRR